MSGDLVAVWEVALSDGVHRIEFEHGTTTGKRVIYIDGKVRIIYNTQLTHQDNISVGLVESTNDSLLKKY